MTWLRTVELDCWSFDHTTNGHGSAWHRAQDRSE